MAGLDPRIWKLAAPALLLVTSCQTGRDIPVDETQGETGDGDGDDGDGDGEGNGDDCVPACGLDQYCLYGDCIDHPPDPECYEDVDCMPGYFCEPVGNDFECHLLGLTNECAAPELIEIPLPDEAQGETLDLEFVDLDADGIDELLLLQPGELLVVTSAQAVTSFTVDPLAQQFTPVRANDDEHLDVVLTAAVPDHAGLLLGNGDGSFAAVTSLAIPLLLDHHAVDWPSGDAEELVALDPETGSPMLSSQLASDSPQVVVFPIDSFSPTLLDQIHVADVNQDGQAEVLLRVRCLVSYQGMAGEIGDVGNSGEPCRSYLERFGPAATPQLMLLAAVGPNTGLRLISGVGVPGATALIPGTIDDLAGVAGLGFVLASPAGTRLLTGDPSSIDCVASFDALPGSQRVVAGEFTDNPGDELVLVSQDQLSLWAQP